MVGWLGMVGMDYGRGRRNQMVEPAGQAKMLDRLRDDDDDDDSHNTTSPFGHLAFKARGAIGLENAEPLNRLTTYPLNHCPFGNKQ